MMLDPPKRPRPLTVYVLTRNVLMTFFAVTSTAACGLVDAYLGSEHPPIVSIDTKPPQYTQADDAQFSFSCSKSDCTFYCLHLPPNKTREYAKQDFSPCNAEHLVPGLNEGSQFLAVFAKDSAGRESQVIGLEWVVDQTAPRTQFPAGLSAYINPQTTGIGFYCEDASPCTYTCQLDEGPKRSCQPPLRLEVLPHGTLLKLWVQAEDAAGNLESLNRANQKTLNIDLEPPIVEITGYPGKTSGGRDNRVGFAVSFQTSDLGTAGAERFECQLDTEPVISDCSSPWEAIVTLTSSAATESFHSLRIRATDAANNQSEWTQKAWLLDRVAPLVLILSRPGFTSTDRTPLFDFACSEANCSYRCQLDAGDEFSCPAQFVTESLKAGTHRINVVAVDLAGNRSEAVNYDWSIIGRWKNFDSSGFHSCGIDQDQQLYCWGQNEFGQIGSLTAIRYGQDKYHESQPTPTRVGAANNWIQVSTGYAQSCGIKSDQSLWCWGLNKHGGDIYGRLGTGSNVEYHAQPQLLFGQDWTHVKVGKELSCATKSDHSVWCWGPRIPQPTAVPLEISSDETLDATLAIEISNEVCVLAKMSRLGSQVTRQYCEWVDHIPGSLRAQSELTAGGLRQLSLGFDHECAITNGDHLYCRGQNTFGQTGNNPEISFGWKRIGAENEEWKSSVAGKSFSCGIKSDGSLWCWGAERLGLRADEAAKIEEPTRLGLDTDWADLITGPHSHSVCAVKSDTTLFCFGDNRFGQLGFDRGDKLIPHAVNAPHATGWLDVDVGENHSCALRDDNEIYCWGSNQSLQSLTSATSLTPRWAKGQLGANILDRSVNSLQHLETRFASTPQPVVSTGVLQPPPHHDLTETLKSWTHSPQWSGLDIFSFGNGNVAWQQDEDVFSWGDNQHSVLGLDRLRILDLGPPTQYELQSDCSSDAHQQISGPYETVPVEAWSEISLGKTHGCARGRPENNGGARLYCWGANQSGQLANGMSSGVCVNGPMSNQAILPDISGSLSNAEVWIDVVSGMNFSCATDIDSHLQCWGENSSGQLGLGHFNDTNTPRLQGNREYFIVAAGAKHACAIDDLGDLWCWGDSQFGQIGINARGANPSPSQVELPMSVQSGEWQSFDAGAFHNCGIIDDQFEYSLWCWGSNRHGQLGLGDKTDQLLPVRVAPDQQWNIISAGTDHSCGISTEGRLYCWGSNSYGKLGHGETALWLNQPTEMN